MFNKLLLRPSYLIMLIVGVVAIDLAARLLDLPMWTTWVGCFFWGFFSSDFYRWLGFDPNR